MSSSRKSRRAAVARTTGFTLIELVIGLVISGILAGVMFQLFQGQGRFVAAQGAREEALQNGRGALDLIANELRAVHPAGLMETESGSIAFVLPRVWGVVCANTPTQLTVAFPKVPYAGYGIPAADTLAGGALPANALVQLRDAAGAWSAPSMTSWVPRPVTDCAALKTVDTNARVLRLTGSGLPSSVPLGGVVAYGERVRYDVAVVPSLGGDAWIRRSTSWAGTVPDMQPLGGPVPSGADNLVFRYYVGNTATSVPSVSDVNQRRTITRIEMRVVTQSREKVGTQKYQRSTDTLMVHLRNQD